MTRFLLAQLLAVLSICSAGRVWEDALQRQPNPGKRDFSRKYFVVHVDDPLSYAAQTNATLEEPFPIEDHWLMSTHTDRKLEKRNANRVYSAGLSTIQRRAALPRDRNDDTDGTSILRRDALKTYPSPLDVKTILDPLFSNQWFLYNPGGRDVNMKPLWDRGILGNNVTVAIVDDGLDYDHPDFDKSFSLEASWDYNLHQNRPKPLLEIDTHGTRCAGEVAAGLNNACGVGVAPNAKVAGIRILSGMLTVADEARALIHQNQLNDIYSCSWGPSDDGRTIAGPSSLVKRAELAGVEEGRGGKGSIYVVASGNGYSHGDGCNYDGYTNSIYTITIGAVDKHNAHPYYAEGCSANMAVTYSSNYVDKIATSDRLDPLDPLNAKCTTQHSGTSAAAPLAAGIFALVLEVRPDLTWRDVQYIVREAAEPFELTPFADFGGLNAAQTDTNELAESKDWQVTADGRKYHNFYGYGVLDSNKLVEVAEKWELVKPQAWLITDLATVDLGIEQRLETEIEVSQQQWDESNLECIEHVRVKLTYQHEQRGKLSFYLRSPQGIESELAAPRRDDLSGEPVMDWEFMSVVHWSEKAVGKWKLVVKSPEGLQGGVHHWQLKFFGLAKDASKTKRFSEVWDQYEPHEDVVEYEKPPSSNETSETSETSAEPPTQTANATEPETAEPETAEPATTTETEPATEELATNTPITPIQPTGEIPHKPEPPQETQTEPDNETPETDKPETDKPETETPDSGKEASNKPRPHSLKYYLGATLLGMLLLSAFIGPVVYWSIKRRERMKRYVELNDEFSNEFELNDYDQFEIDASDETDTADDAGLMANARHS